VREAVSLAVQTQRIGLFEPHEVDGVAGERNEDDFHYEGVEGFPGHEEVDVAGEEDHEEEFLGAVGEACVEAGVPITFFVARILSSNMRTAAR
jgi:hypothetical protein